MSSRIATFFAVMAVIVLGVDNSVQAARTLTASVNFTNTILEGSTPTDIKWTINGGGPLTSGYWDAFLTGTAKYWNGSTLLDSHAFDAGNVSTFSGTSANGLGFAETFLDDGNYTRKVEMVQTRYNHYYGSTLDSPNLLWTGSSTAYTFTIKVLNVAPTVTSVSSSLAENATFYLDEPFDIAATATDPGINDVLTYNWDLDNDGAFDDFTGASGTVPAFTIAHSGNYTFKVQVSDGDGGVTTKSLYNVIAVPEPASLILLGLGCLGLLAIGIRRS